ncbi:hypothetical protein P154DRAFT_110386 [Amniculicola lignicola CBS 123094]|uniref:Uncharacterized protein n=1 Tax=Amniculicola lignicola CBS 123094 TaxID=1392246 RepID=A0A6A5WMZ8_9PLEO|nr:hypothetical protein P154DRAFT_110386 [Amniculicola lignicola CBS 123094]
MVQYGVVPVVPPRTASERQRSAPAQNWYQRRRCRVVQQYLAACYAAGSWRSSRQTRASLVRRRGSGLSWELLRCCSAATQPISTVYVAARAVFGRRRVYSGRNARARRAGGTYVHRPPILLEACRPRGPSLQRGTCWEQPTGAASRLHALHSRRSAGPPSWDGGSWMRGI